MTTSHPEWPLGIREISVENLDSLGINDEHQLFWNGRQIEVQRRLTLSWPQKLGAAMVVLATVLGGIGGFAQGATAVIDFGCVRHTWRHWCPAVAVSEAPAQPAVGRASGEAPSH